MGYSVFLLVRSAHKQQQKIRKCMLMSSSLKAMTVKQQFS